MWSSSSSILWSSSIRSNWIKRNITIFIIFFLLYLVNRFLKPTTNIYLIDYILQCHFNDFIGAIIFCVYTNTILVISKRRKPIFNFWVLLVYMLIIAICWEFLFPIILPYSTSDFLDVIAYLFGTIVYFLLNIDMVNKKSNNIII